MLHALLHMVMLALELGEEILKYNLHFSHTLNEEIRARVAVHLACLWPCAALEQRKLPH